MRKVYKTNYNSLTLQLEFRGLRAKVEFSHGMISHNIPARLATSDPLLQEIIESDSRYGEVYTLESAEPTPEDLESVTTKVDEQKAPKSIKIAVKKVKSLTDAIDYLSEKGKVCETLDEVNEAAEELNVSFPNLK